jgi:hypothetical protein
LAAVSSEKAVDFYHVKSNCGFRNLNSEYIPLNRISRLHHRAMEQSQRLLREIAGPKGEILPYLLS